MAADPNVWSLYGKTDLQAVGVRATRGRSLGPQPRGGLEGGCQPHVPCLLKEAVDNVLPMHLRRDDGTYDGVYVDCTFGRGGHTRELLSRLSPSASCYAFDVDPEAVAVAQQLETQDRRFRIIHRPFGDLEQVFAGTGAQLDGVLVDLGVSSPQLDDYHRGFNFKNDVRPDMRMNQSQGIPAHQWLQMVTPEELAWVIHSYGEDDDALLSERIAEYILLKQRDAGGIFSTRRLSDIVRVAKAGLPDPWMHPAKLTLQSIRVFLNQEMQQLERLLHATMEKLRPEGRFCVITFKRKEANLVRQFIREHEEPDTYMEQKLPANRLCELFPLLNTDKPFTVQQIGAAIKPTSEEVERNSRSRSSAVHILVKMPRRSPVRSEAVRGSEERFKEPDLQPAFVGSTVCPDGDLGLGESTGARPAEQRLAEAPRIRSGGECRLLVGNLSNHTTKQGLLQHFQQVEGVLRAEILSEGTGGGRACPQRHGTVEFSSAAHAERAGARMTGTMLDGCRISLQEDRSAAWGSYAGPARVCTPRHREVTPPPPLRTDAFQLPADPQGWRSASAHQGAGAPATAAPPAPAASPEAAEPATGHVVQYRVRATKDFTVTVPVGKQETSGYLTLTEGSVVTTLYVGTGGAEAGWNYGCAEGGRHGWFPSTHVSAALQDLAG